MHETTKNREERSRINEASPGTEALRKEGIPVCSRHRSRHVSRYVDPAKTLNAIRAHSVRGLDFFLILLIHEIGHAFANTLCGRACSIQIERSGFAYTVHDAGHKLDKTDEVFVAAMGGSIHLAFLLAATPSALTPKFRQDYVLFAIDRDAARAGVTPQLLRAVIESAILPHLTTSFITRVMQLAQELAEQSKRSPDLCYFSVKNDVRTLVPGVFKVLSRIRIEVRTIIEKVLAQK